MGDQLIGIDVGTSNIKVGVVDQSMRIVALEIRSYAVEHPGKDWAQIGADTLWNSLMDCLRGIARKHPLDRVKAIGFSCMSPGLVAFGEDGSVLQDPILYLDRRSSEEADWIARSVGAQRVFSIAANNVMPGAISCTSMLWIKHKRPDIYERTRWFGHINSLMGYRMTGEMAIDLSNASYTGVFATVEGKNWSGELCREMGLDIEKLPTPLESTAICGALNAPEVIACGVPAGTPVVIGGADSPCSALACGVISPNGICQSVGTTNVLTICTDRMRPNRAFLNRCHVVPGLWVYQGAMSNAGSVVSWACETLCADLKDRAAAEGISPYRLMDLEALDSPAGASGVVFLPYLAGERCPVWDPNAKGVFFGLTRETRRNDLVRAVLESTCYATRQILEIAQDHTGHDYNMIDTVGGGAKSEIWTQMKADIIGKAMRMLDVTDAAMIGAAMLAGIGVGMYRDAAEATALFRKEGKSLPPRASQEERASYLSRFTTYTALYQALKGLF